MSTHNFLAAFALAAALFAPQAAHAEARETQDFLAGNGTAGPYTLCWKHIRPTGEDVRLGGSHLVWAVDYKLDPESGTLTFTRPLPAGAAVTVRYGYDTAQAVSQRVAFSLPMALSLGGGVSLIGPADPAAPAFGLAGGWQGSHDGKLTTKILFAPGLTDPAAPAAPAPAGSLSRLGVSVNGETSLGRPLRVAFGYSRAGANAGDLGSDAWQAGLQKLTVSGTLTPDPRAQATFGYAQTDPTTPDAGPSQSQVSAGLSLTPTDALHVQTGLVQTQGGPGGPTQTLSAAAALKPGDKVELDADISHKAAADKTADARALDVKAALTPSKLLALTAGVAQAATGGGAAARTLTAGLSAKPLDRATLDASYSLKSAPDKGADAQAIDLKAGLVASKFVALTADLNRSSLGAQSATDLQAIRLALTPRPALSLDTGLSLTQGAAADTQAADVNGHLQPWRFLQLSGGYTWRATTAHQVDAPGAFDSSRASFTLAPLSALRVVGAYAQNPDDDAGSPQRLARRSLGLEASVGALSLSGGYDWSRPATLDATAIALHVGLGLRFSGTTRLTGDYKQGLTTGPASTGTNAYSLGLTRDLGERFNLSLNGALQQPTGPANSALSNVTAAANLGMKF